MIAVGRLGEILWSLLIIYLMLMYIVVVITVWMDIFRSDDIGGGKKAAWILALLFFPLISLVVYLVKRGDGIGTRNLERANAMPSTAPPAPPTPATELAVAKQLLEAGTITSAEFEQIKARVLS